VTNEVETRSESFYAGAIGRIQRFMIALAVALSAVCWWRFGARIALGFFCGCAIAYLNFRWLEKVVSALADRATQSEYRQSSGGIVFRFLLRYFLMALAAYAIFSVSRASLSGLFAGLFLPVAGIACEAGYEVYGAVFRGL
jgi:ATP synthase I chain